MEFQQYKISDGLVGSRVISLAQDKRGYIWLGTLTGLSRFDGMTFTNFTSSDKLINLENDYVQNLTTIDDSLLLIATLKGCLAVNIYNLKSQFFFVNDSTVFSDMVNSAWGFVKLNSGNYVMISKTGYYEFDKTGKLVCRRDYFDPKEKDNRGFHKKTLWNTKNLMELGNDRFAFYAFEKLEILDFNRHKSYEPAADDPLRLFAENSVLRKKVGKYEYVFLKIKSDSIFYLNTERGILKGYELPFDVSSEIYHMDNVISFIGNNEYVVPSYRAGFYTFTLNNGDIYFDVKKHLPEYKITSAFRDVEGRIWLGTNDGLLKQKNVNTLIKFFPINEDEDKEVIYSDLALVNNKLFVMNANAKNGIEILDGRTKKVIHKVNLPEKYTSSILPSSVQSYYRDTLWISTGSGIVWLDVNNYSFGEVVMPDYLKDVTLEMSEVNKNGIAWMNAFYRQLYVSYNVKTREFTYYDETTDIKPQLERPVGSTFDSYGNVWFYGHGLQRWNTSKGCFDTLITNFGKVGDNVSFFSKVAGDAQGRLWVYLPDIGLIKYDIKGCKIERVNLRKYTPIQCYTTFSGILGKYMWFGYTDRLLRFNTETERAEVYDQNDGMPDAIFTSGIYYDTLANEGLSCMNGKYLISFKNNSFDSIHRKLFIEYVSAGNSYFNYYPGDTLKLDYWNNTLTIKFTVLDFNLKYPRKFVYSIDNTQQWNSILQTQPLFLYNLEPGWHTVTIMSMYNQEQFNTVKLKIYIIPPYWKTNWFYALCIAFIIFIISLIVFLIIRKSKSENKLMIELKEFEMKALHAQMNPHFIFNCLNSIKALVVNDKNEEASRYINSFSKLVRLNLEHSRKQFITLKENIEYVDRYLQSEKLRFSDFNYTVKVDEDLDTERIMVVPMLLQPIVENAIWHGLHSVSTGRTLVISYLKVEFGVKCIIDDNGIGIKKSLQLKNPTQRNSVGMDNIKQRIHLFNQKHQMNYKLEIIDKSDLETNETGTRVILYFNTRVNYD